MLTLEECEVIASKKLATLMLDLELYKEPIHSGEYGWVFSYQSIQYKRSNDFRDAFVGNSPILVDRRSGDALFLGSGLPSEVYVENYLSCGDPFKFLGKRIEFSDWSEGAQKTEATRTIQRKTGLGLAEAKLRVDECLAGKTALVECRTADDASALVKELRALGFSGKQLRD